MRSTAPAPGGKGKEALAFYLNAYNAWILHEVLEAAQWLQRDWGVAAAVLSATSFSADVEEVQIDDLDTFHAAQSFFRRTMPQHLDVIKHYTGKKPLFSKHQLEEQIDRIYGRKVPLGSGGATTRVRSRGSRGNQPRSQVDLVLPPTRDSY